jgi:hypothetical protein
MTAEQRRNCACIEGLNAGACYERRVGHQGLCWCECHNPPQQASRERNPLITRLRDPKIIGHEGLREEAALEIELLQDREDRLRATDHREALRKVCEHSARGSVVYQIAASALADLPVETSVTPEFAAGFERGTAKTVVAEVGAMAKDRTAPYWSGFALACEEIQCRLDEAWAALPVGKDCQHRENNPIADTHAKWCVECGAFYDGSQWVHPWRSAPETKATYPRGFSPQEVSECLEAFMKKWLAEKAGGEHGR